MRRSITMLLATLAVTASAPALARAPFVLHSNQESDQLLGAQPAAEGEAAIQLVSAARGSRPWSLPPSFWESYVGGGTATAAPPGPDSGGPTRRLADPDEHGNSPALSGGDHGVEQSPVVRSAPLPAPGALWLLAAAALGWGRRRR